MKQLESIEGMVSLPQTIVEFCSSFFGSFKTFFQKWHTQTTWVKFLTLFVVGALSALGYAPVYAWWCLSFSLVICLYALEKAQTFRQALGLGWVWGWGYFSGGLYWISFSLGVEWTRFFWVLPFSLLGLPAILACFLAPVTGGTWFFTRPGVSRWLGFAACWGIFEWLRGHLFTGFPWNLVAYSLGDSAGLMQPAAWVGSYGLGVWVVLVLSFPYLLPFFKGIFKKLALSGFLLASVWGLKLAGERRLEAFPLAYHETVFLRIVQPNISQKEKWSPEKRRENFQKLVDLSLSPSQQPVTHLIWPEAAVPFCLEADQGFEGMPAFTTPEGAFILGAPRKQESTSPSQARLAWNSLWVLDSKGKIFAFYDKSHLVPFGEYLPFRWVLEKMLPGGGLKKMTYGDVDFQPGTGLKTLECPGGPPFSPLICYEVIFPGHVVAPDISHPQPEWLLNLTNDAWFGQSSGPYQHLDSCRFRAVEEGLPLVRAANTGISAVIDPYGRCIASLPLDQAGILDSPLPRALLKTPYRTYRDNLWIAWLLVLIFLVWRMRNRPSLKI
ncbi:MAG: apolipoprotein N-acyltransferase [Alphaproteobacteria bacterium]